MPPGHSDRAAPGAQLREQSPRECLVSPKCNNNNNNNDDDDDDDSSSCKNTPRIITPSFCLHHPIPIGIMGATFRAKKASLGGKNSTHQKERVE